VVSRLTRSSAVLVAPLVLVLAAFFVVPVLYLLNESFRTAEGAFTLDSYTDFLGNSVYRTILVRTFVVAAACTVICAALAYPYAYLMTVVGVRMRRWLLVCVLLPFWTSLMVRTYAWLVLLQDSGPVRAALDVVGLGDVPLAGSTTGVLIGMAQILLPFMVLPVYNNLQQIDRTDVLAAQSLGATPRRAFLRVYLPQSLPGLYAGGLLVFIIGLGFYITPVILGSPQNSMMSQLIVQQVNSRLDWASAGAMAAVLAVVTFVCVGLAGRFVDVQRAFGGSGDRDG
jgi:putative spermidine/putrescine transport system permease protein